MKLSLFYLNCRQSFRKAGRQDVSHHKSSLLRLKYSHEINHFFLHMNKRMSCKCWDRKKKQAEVTSRWIMHICISFIAKCHTYYLFQSKKKTPPSDKKKWQKSTHRSQLVGCYISWPGEFALARFCTRDLCRFCRGLPSGLPTAPPALRSVKSTWSPGYVYIVCILSR